MEVQKSKAAGGDGLMEEMIKGESHRVVDWI